MLARKSTLIVLNSIVGGILGYVALKTVALYMGAGQYGQLAFATGLVGTITFLTDLGFNGAHKKRVSEGRDVQDCVTTYGIVILCLAGAYIALVLGGLAFNRLFLGRTFRSTTETAILLVTLANAADAIRRIGRVTFEARQEAARSELAIFSEHLVRVPAMILFALLYASARGREGPIFDFLRSTAPGLAEVVFANGGDFLALAVFGAAAVSLVVALGLVSRHIGAGRFDRDLFRSYLRFALPVSVVIAANAISRYADKATLGFFWTDATAGQFYGIQRLLIAFTVIRGSVAALMMPAISDRHARGDEDGVQSLLTPAIRYLSLIAVPMAFGVATLSGPFIRILLSNAWLPARRALGIMAFVALVHATILPLRSLLLGTDRPKLLARIAVVTTIINVGALLLLVPTSLFGIPAGGLKVDGAAVANLASALGNAILVAWFAPVRPDPGLGRSIALHWVAGAGMAGVVWLVHTEVFALVRWFHVPMFLALGAGTYFGLLALLGEFDRKDLDFFWAALHPGEMGSYIRGELEQR